MLHKAWCTCQRNETTAPPNRKTHHRGTFFFYIFYYATFSVNCHSVLRSHTQLLFIYLFTLHFSHPNTRKILASTCCFPATFSAVNKIRAHARSFDVGGGRAFNWRLLKSFQKILDLGQAESEPTNANVACHLFRRKCVRLRGSRGLRLSKRITIFIYHAEWGGFPIFPLHRSSRKVKGITTCLPWQKWWINSISIIGADQGAELKENSVSHS